jgi:hypothetical protein
VFTKDHIIEEIKRTANENGGKPHGHRRFAKEAGVKSSDWEGKFRARWGDAIKEAGFEPNTLQGARDKDELLENLARLARELGHFPVRSEINLKARTELGFAWEKTFTRSFGGKQALAIRFRDFCAAHGYEDVEALCDAVIARSVKSEANIDRVVTIGNTPEIGYVYLLKSGRHFKVGRSNAVGRRERELAIQLPEEAKVIHSIKTDDPAGIEADWHTRFSDRRKNGEWFELDAQDVAAFKRRKFM